MEKSRIFKKTFWAREKNGGLIEIADKKCIKKKNSLLKRHLMLTDKINIQDKDLIN